MKIDEIIWGDLFAGGGGTTTGAYMVNNTKVAWALNHSKEAIFTHEINHPETEHYQADIRNMNEKKLSPVNAIWASLECTNFSLAKGGQSRDADSRTLAWELPRYIVHCNPYFIVIENVKEFLDWGPLRIKKDDKNSTTNYSSLATDKKGKYIFIPVESRKGEDYKKWVDYIKLLGYPNYDYKILDSADYGAYTTRKRLFIIFSKKDFPLSFPKPTHHKDGSFGLPKWNSCKELINTTDTGNSIFDREKPLVDKTLQRIAGGIKKYVPEFSQFILKYYGNGDNVSSLNEPLHTITTKDRHALISIEKKQFITEHIWGATGYQILDKPLKTILTKEAKQLVTIEIKSFISNQYNSNGNPQYSNQSLDEPLKTITTVNKHQFISTFLGINTNGMPEFDIKMRFLTPDELALITGFPKSYKWYGSKKFQTHMIGNAVPTLLAKALIQEVNKTITSNILNYSIAV